VLEYPAGSGFITDVEIDAQEWWQESNKSLDVIDSFSEPQLLSHTEPLLITRLKTHMQVVAS
jgi:hypothetical protein